MKQLDKNSAALESFNNAIESDPNSDRAWNGRGAILGNSGDFSNAIKCFKKAIELNPDNLDYLSNLTLTYTALNAYGELLDFLQTAEKHFNLTKNIAGTIRVNAYQLHIHGLQF